MPNLSHLRIKAGYNQQKDAIEALQKDIPHLDKSLMSKIESGKVLPVRKDSDAICKLYNITPFEAWNPDEADLFGVFDAIPPSQPKQKKPDGHKLKHKFTARLTERAMSILTPEILGVCGYRSKTDWFYHCLERLIKEYAYRNKKPSGGKPED